MKNEYEETINLYKSFEKDLQEILQYMKDDSIMYEKSFINLMMRFRKIIDENEKLLNRLKEEEKRIEYEKEKFEKKLRWDNRELTMHLRGQYYIKTRKLEEEYQHKMKYMPQHRIRKDGTSSMKRNFTLESSTKKVISKLAMKSKIKNVVEDAIKHGIEVKDGELSLYSKSGEKKEQLVVWLDSKIDEKLVMRCDELNMKYNIFLENAIRHKYKDYFDQ